MDEVVKFLIAGVGLMLLAISPIFVGVSTYNTAWENPEEPTFGEAVSDYLDEAHYVTTHPGFPLGSWVSGIALTSMAMGLNRGKTIYGSQ